jgi:hypothetical protein
VHEFYEGLWEAGLGLGFGVHCVAGGLLVLLVCRLCRKACWGRVGGHLGSEWEGIPEDGQVDAHEAIEHGDVVRGLGVSSIE